MIIRKNEIINIFLWTGALSIACIFLLRFFYIIRFDFPLQIITTGSEEESLYALWKFVKGFDLYADHTKYPFAASYFNYLFYYFYGSILQASLYLFNLEDAWLPTLGKLISCSGALVSLFLFTRIARTVSAPLSTSLPLGIIVFFNPVMAYWNLSVRPDVWALTCEVFALYLITRKPLNPQRILLIALVLYAAWAFKHSFIILTVFTGFILLFKNFKYAVLLGSALLILILTTLFLGNKLSEHYIYFLLFSQKHMFISLGKAIQVFQVFSGKMFPLILAFGIALLTGLKNQTIQNKILYGIISILIIVLPFLMSMKEGSSDNYYFTSIFLMGFVVLKYRENKIYLRSIMVLFLLPFFLIVSGIKGELFPPNLHAYYWDIRENSETLKGSKIVLNDNYANLPWILQGETADVYCVIATTYGISLLQGDSIQYGGTQKMVDNVEFDHVFIPVKYSDRINELTLNTGYDLQKSNNYFVLFSAK